MPQDPLPPATYIEDHNALCRLVESLAQESLLAIDTESNSLYAYKERVCLIQLSSRTADYIIDPLAIDDMQPLAPLMESWDVEKIFHAAEYDIMCMKRDFGFVFNNLFDTMVAARICGIQSVGLGDLLEESAGIQVDKSHQRDDWGKRPLPSDSLRYAQMDTHYLLDLRDMLHTQLNQMGRLAEAQEAFSEVCEAPAATPREFDPDGFWRIGKPHRLNRKQMCILRELYLLREEIAQEQNLPPFRVLGNETLVRLARKSPRRFADLRAARAVSSRQIRRYGSKILGAVKRGKSTRHLPLPPREKPLDPVVAERYAALHSWRKKRARKRGVESDIIISKQKLWDLAHQAPSSLDELEAISGMGPWRLSTYGSEILGVIENFE